MPGRHARRAATPPVHQGCCCVYVFSKKSALLQMLVCHHRQAQFSAWRLVMIRHARLLVGSTLHVRPMGQGSQGTFILRLVEVHLCMLMSIMLGKAGTVMQAFHRQPQSNIRVCTWHRTHVCVHKHTPLHKAEACSPHRGHTALVSCRHNPTCRCNAPPTGHIGPYVCCAALPLHLGPQWPCTVAVAVDYPAHPAATTCRCPIGRLPVHGPHAPSMFPGRAVHHFHMPSLC